MKEILFVCQGNVDRSQMAEAYYNHLTGRDGATSAGIDDVADKYGGQSNKRNYRCHEGGGRRCFTAAHKAIT